MHAPRIERPRTMLASLFVTIFLAMLFVTVRASLVRSIFDNRALLFDTWFQATLCDAYCGFLTFYIWVAWKERTIWSRIVWFILIMSLGNFAMSAYVLRQLWILPTEADVRDVLISRGTK